MPRPNRDIEDEDMANTDEGDKIFRTKSTERLPNLLQPQPSTSASLLQPLASTSARLLQLQASTSKGPNEDQNVWERATVRTASPPLIVDIAETDDEEITKKIYWS